MPQFFDCQQGSEEWFALRAGIPTSSEFKVLLARGRADGTTKTSLTRRKYLLQLAGEILTGTPMVTYSNAAMENGKAKEAEARDLYGHYHNLVPDQIGFIKHGRAGCSPDALIGENGLLEIKVAVPDLLLDILLRQEFPPQHKAQTQGALWIAHREWIDLAIYWPDLPLFVKRAYRDDKYIAELAAAVDVFNADLDEIVRQVRVVGELAPMLSPTQSVFAHQLRASLALSEETPAQEMMREWKAQQPGYEEPT